jgi:hypothetical protein
MTIEQQAPHLFDDASEEELLGFSHKELAEYAADKGISYTSRMNKAKIVTALLELRASGTLPDDEQAATDEDGSSEGDPDEDDEPEAITPDEARKFEGAADDMIESWLGRHRDARQCLRDFAELTLDKRAEARRKEAAANAMKSDLGYYRITKGGRFCIGGLWTMLPAGSCVTEATHNFAELRAQGFELEPVQSVRATENHAGLPVMSIDVE